MHAVDRTRTRNSRSQNSFYDGLFGRFERGFGGEWEGDVGEWLRQRAAHLWFYAVAVRINFTPIVEKLEKIQLN